MDLKCWAGTGIAVGIAETRNAKRLSLAFLLRSYAICFPHLNDSLEWAAWISHIQVSIFVRLPAIRIYRVTISPNVCMWRFQKAEQTFSPRRPPIPPSWPEVGPNLSAHRAVGISVCISHTRSAHSNASARTRVLAINIGSCKWAQAMTPNTAAYDMTVLQIVAMRGTFAHWFDRKCSARIDGYDFRLHMRSTHTHTLNAQMRNCIWLTLPSSERTQNCVNGFDNEFNGSRMRCKCAGRTLRRSKANATTKMEHILFYGQLLHVYRQCLLWAHFWMQKRENEPGDRLPHHS